MNEKIYKTMSSTGACSLAVGIIVLTTGIVTGVMMIVNGVVFRSETGENIEKRNKTYHTDTGKSSVCCVCSCFDLFPFLFRRIRKSGNGRTTIQIQSGSIC